jgi:hypothetical protein
VQGNAFFLNFQFEQVLDKLENKQNHVDPGREPHRPKGARTALTTSDHGRHRLATPMVPCRAALRPPPLPAIKGTRRPTSSFSSSRPSPPLGRLVPPPSSHRVAPTPIPHRAPRRRHEHRAVVYHLSAPRAVDRPPRLLPPPPFPSGQPHIAAVLILPVRTPPF